MIYGGDEVRIIMLLNICFYLFKNNPINRIPQYLPLREKKLAQFYAN